MSEEPLRLGPFELGDVLGRGGMGVVYDAVHAKTGTPVAIKVMIGDRAAEPRYRADFRSEVRAVAGLDHPGVVMVLDLGEVPQEAAERAPGELVAGSPWMAMELAPMGTLHEVARPLPWPLLRRALLGLLDALAHAHSRDIVHRDLKPANVLLGGRGDTHSIEAGGRLWRGAVRLTDFGLAHAGQDRAGGGDTELNTAGTPRYMAPEQFKGHWRDYGAWTDLYALGCMAWELAIGKPPFLGDNLFALAYAHTLGDRPSWPADAAERLPLGLGAWIGNLIAREPGDRFQRAADAAWALTRLEVPEALWEDLPPSGGEHHSSVAMLPAAGETFFLTQRPASARSSDLAEALGFASQAAVGAAAALGGATARMEVVADDLYDDEPDDDGLPAMPPSWRRPRATRPSKPLVGAGLGLYGLRVVPMVGRRQARGQLWGALADVRQTGRPRLLLLHGPAGTGKSRLGQWLGRRAEEVGAATLLHARHGAIPTSDHGVPAALSRHLRCLGLDREALAERLAGLLAAAGRDDDGEARELVDLLSPPAEGPSSLPTAEARREAIARTLVGIATPRPMVLLLDDVAHSPDSIALAERLLQTTAPILVLLTSRDGTLVERPAAADAIDGLLRQERTSRIEVGPLPEGDRQQLIAELLGFRTGLAAAIDERTGGNPLFSTALIGDWVARGVLVPGESGFELRPGADDRLPDDLHDLASRRLSSITTDLGPPAEQALEAAAALGVEVDSGEWTQLALDRGLAAPVGTLLERLLLAALARPTSHGWAFANAMLPESLERSARDAGRWAELNRACAAMLSAAAGPNAPAERVGLHLVEAEEFEAALAPLLDGALSCQERSDPRSALALLEHRAVAERALRLPDAEPRRAEGLAVRAWAHRALGELDEAEALASAVETAAPDSRAAARAVLVRAQVAHRRGDFVVSRAEHQRARMLCRAAGLEREATQAIQGLADLALRSGQTREALALFERAGLLFARMDRPVEEADCLRAQALATGRLGDVAGADDRLRRALSRYEAAGNRRGMADCLNSLAEIARKGGRFVDAEDGYRRALALYQASGVGGDLARINLGLALLGQERFGEAARVLDPAVEQLRGGGRRAVQACAEAAVLPCRAAEHDWDALSETLDRARTLLRETSTSEWDVAVVLEQAGRLAAMAGQPGPAADVWALAIEQLRALGASDQASALERERASL